MKRLIIAVLFLLAICGCEEQHSSNQFPRLLYQHSGWSASREITLGDGYILNEGHLYDMIETENGYDLVLHFVKEDTND